MLNRNFTPFPVLTTERLSLRQLEINDEQEIFMLRSDLEINKYLGRKLSISIEDARNFINKINDNIHMNDSLYWAITRRNQNILMGTVCLFNFSDENEQCEIGYELLRNFQGQGIMHEAVSKVLNYAFQTIKVQRIEALFHRDNQKSKKLLDRFNFRNSNKLDATNPDLVAYYLLETKDNQ